MSNTDRNEEYEQYVRWRKALSGRERIMTQIEFEGMTDLLKARRDGNGGEKFVEFCESRRPWDPMGISDIGPLIEDVKEYGYSKISSNAEHESQMRLQRLNEEIEKINKRYRKQRWLIRIAFLMVGIGAFLVLCSCAAVSDKSVTIENLFVDYPLLQSNQ